MNTKQSKPWLWITKGDKGNGHVLLWMNGVIRFETSDALELAEKMFEYIALGYEIRYDL